jgi:glycosyltransferase involved in cell wall biosynthesis/SAM-dependent methyltransferase
MRIAFFSPLPPAKSGIADYSAALLDPLARLAQVETFASKPAHFDASACDAAVYQLGNNPHHTFAYEVAMKHPGVVVLHEANLHHLIVDLTIRRGDWDGYLREVECNGGPNALDYARRYVRTLERGPDYDLPMLGSVLDRSRAAIVHSGAVEEQLRAHGFTRPIARIPHGAWIADADRTKCRARLGLDERAPLFGIFGFLKPYKRVAQSLRAFRRLLRVHPDAHMILVGERHPELRLDLPPEARHIDFAPIEDFNGYLGACDAVLNLRYPTVGESSGTLLRAFGMGKAVVVSDVGSFREYPDEICLKAPVDSSEEQYLFEYMNLLASRPEVAQALGEKAREWVARECTWLLVAERYASFLEAVVDDSEWQVIEPKRVEPITVPGKYIAGWAPPENGARSYIETHLTRLEKTLAITPPGGPEDRVLEMGAYLHITPALKARLGYGEVRGCYYGSPAVVEDRTARSAEGEEFTCKIDLFDAEKDGFPYPNGYFSTVLCCELIEHLSADPMHMMIEINRILKPGGHLVLTTPNIVSLRAIAGILGGYNPLLFPAYIRPGASGERQARHAREYAPREIRTLFEDCGFDITLLETAPFRLEPKPELAWVEHLLDRYMLAKELRGDGIYAVGRKAGPARERYPAWLYS